MPSWEAEEVQEVMRHEANQTLKHVIGELSFQECKDMFDCYSEEHVVVPDEVLAFWSLILANRVTDLENKLKFPKPYHLRAAGANEVICLPREDEVGVYLALYDIGLRSPLDKDLESV